MKKFAADIVDHEKLDVMMAKADALRSQNGTLRKRISDLTAKLRNVVYEAPYISESLVNEIKEALGGN